VNASEELVSPPGALPEAPLGASSLDAAAAADPGDPLGLQLEGSSLVPDLPWQPDGPAEGLDLITQDSAELDEGLAVTGELPMLDLDDNALQLEDVPESGAGALLVEEGPGEASLEGDAPGAIEAIEFDDVD